MTNKLGSDKRFFVLGRDWALLLLLEGRQKASAPSQDASFLSSESAAFWGKDG